MFRKETKVNHWKSIKQIHLQMTSNDTSGNLSTCFHVTLVSVYWRIPQTNNVLSSTGMLWISSFAKQLMSRINTTCKLFQYVLIGGIVHFKWQITTVKAGDQEIPGRHEIATTSWGDSYLGPGLRSGPTESSFFPSFDVLKSNPPNIQHALDPQSMRFNLSKHP